MVNLDEHPHWGVQALHPSLDSARIANTSLVNDGILDEITS